MKIWHPAEIARSTPILAALLLSFCPPLHAAESAAPGLITLKVGMLAPEASSLVSLAKEGFLEAQQRSNGRLKFRLYAGGVLGDEPDMIRKVRIGQLEAAAISGGLSTIVPEVSVLSLPFLFRNYEEIDYVRSRLFDRLSRDFEKEGMVLLLWFDIGGFIQLFSSEPVRSLKDLAPRKVMTWSAVPIGSEFLKAFPMKAVPLEVTDVLQAFQTGMIDSVFTTPLMLITFQVQKHVRYMTRLNLSHIPVALLMSRKAWDSIPREVQDSLTVILTKFARLMVERAREDDDVALKGLARRGVQIVSPEAKAMEEFHGLGETVQEEFADKLYSRELLNTVLQELGEFRSSRASPASGIKSSSSHR